MTTFFALIAPLFFIVSLHGQAQSFQGRAVIGEAAARQHVLSLLRGKLDLPTRLVPDQATAIAVAEPMLFRLYGKVNIIRQQPYEVYLIDGFWYISGTLPQGSKGGVFEIVLNSATGQVLDVTHGK